MLVLVPQTCVGFAWENYPPRTISQIMLDHEDTANIDALTINTADEKYRVTVTYLGAKRPIQSARQQLIADWVKTVGLDADLVSWFKHEIQVLEGKDAYWLPIQEVLVPHLGKELSSGDTVDLYIMWIGRTRTDWVFLINEFQKSTTLD